MTSRITQCDSRIGCGRSGQPRPPTSRRTEPQSAGSAVTFPGLDRLTGPGPLDDPGSASPAVRELVPGFGACPECRPRTSTASGVPAGVSAARLLRRDPRSASPPGAMGPCSMHDGQSTGATATSNEDRWVAPMHCCTGAPSDPYVPLVAAYGSSKPQGALRRRGVLVLLRRRLPGAGSASGLGGCRPVCPCPAGWSRTAW